MKSKSGRGYIALSFVILLAVFSIIQFLTVIHAVEFTDAPSVTQPAAEPVPSTGNTADSGSSGGWLSNLNPFKAKTAAQLEIENQKLRQQLENAQQGSFTSIFNVYWGLVTWLLVPLILVILFKTFLGTILEWLVNALGGKSGKVDKILEKLIGGGFIGLGIWWIIAIILFAIFKSLPFISTLVNWAYNILLWVTIKVHSIISSAATMSSVLIAMILAVVILAGLSVLITSLFKKYLRRESLEEASETGEEIGEDIAKAKKVTRAIVTGAQE